VIVYAVFVPAKTVIVPDGDIQPPERPLAHILYFMAVKQAEMV
jgi:hypothetical protein